MTRLPAEQRARLQELRSRKEVGQFLMPDAPPSKNRRRQSPVRVPCPLVPGTPEVPPPRIPQNGNRRSQRWTQVVLTFEVRGHGKRENQLAFTPSSGVIMLKGDQDVGEHIFVEADIEMVGFSPTTSFSAERPILQNFSPGPSTSSTRPGIFYV
ncbi:hypothetical protein HF086_014744 [Spodoptera exigua]|uniref:Uncharacterized protein n=1 Tax=Spodoptera exigua TaxID=7107 RepID=A0A922SC21_SPOEX|nr:hypothetical protein HF086_014744 [Spodoptera exigua]